MINITPPLKALCSLPGAIARVSSLLLLTLSIPLQLEAAGPAPVNLGSTTNFAILSGAAITSTGGGVITGNVGASPIAGSAIGVTCAQVIGTIYAVDASGPACAVIDPTRLTTAKGDLTTAFNDAAGRTPVPTGPFLNPNGGNIGGLNLGPGLYKFTGTALITGADVTLTGGPNDVWIFQIASDLQVGSGIKVLLAGGAQARNIFWQVGTSAVLGTFSVFNGTILADQSITINTSATMTGRALAFSAGVTFNGAGLILPPSPAALAPEIAVEQPVGTDLIDGVSTTSFGSVSVGASSSLTFTITNKGTADLTVSGILIDGADSAMYTVVTNPAALVVPGGSTTFTVRFTPASAGLKNAALHIANNDSNENPFDISLSGTGVVAPEIVVEQPAGTDLIDGVSNRDFGSVDVTNSTSLTFIIRNIGSANLTGLGITIDGADSTMFTVTASPTAPVVPGGSTTFTVRFAPVGTGLKTAALHIASNDSDENPFDISLSGTGTGGVLITFVSPITLNPQTGLFEQRVRLSNNNPNSVTAVRLLIEALPADVRVYNASGSTIGTPFVQYNNTVPPAGTVDFLIEYYRANRQAIPQPTFEVQATTPVTATATGTVMAIDRNVQLVGGRFLIEFSATPGRTYAVQYSSDLASWKTATPTITAPANRVQWYDDGPPKTESSPTAGSRFYRVIELP